MRYLAVAVQMCVLAVALCWPLSVGAQTGAGASSQGNSGTGATVLTGSGSDGQVMATLNNMALTIVPVSDRCGRSYYITGTLVSTPGSGSKGGTIANGQMCRCTNKELLTKCPQLGKSYNLSITANWEPFPLPNGTMALKIELTHAKEIWNKTECKLAKKEEGGDVIILLPTPPPSPPNTWWQNFLQTINDATGGIIHNGLYFPADHPLK